jgi:predicted HNH restriction endonuclease
VEKVKCEICGFVPVHKAQLDIDHIDGNRMNNDILNLQVLCANCHRLKTMENGDHLF